ncbi:group III truncated hemoglobin [Aquimarina sp. I32.4]|uniref:group III truncated hemoglobin n=1 Tax=Aquimarina sp. I32.4 TaxID=2053903 RepID=UPI000CDEE3DE|nr:group III truncated hemoglobin [Aquimarina sp. I32.4]
MKDISSRKDIEFLMNAFYKDAFADPKIGIFFTKIAKIDLKEHIPEITDFWEQQLFRTRNYRKNVMQIHKDLNLKKKLENTHFDTWLTLFHKAVDTNFKGEKADLIKTRALSIITMMRIKIVTSH